MIRNFLTTKFKKIEKEIKKKKKKSAGFYRILLELTNSQSRIVFPRIHNVHVYTG